MRFLRDLLKLWILCFLLIISITIQLKAQGQVENTKIFTITTNNDTIQFLRISKDTIFPKPVLLFCQGSLPLPLILIDKEDSVILPLSNFDYNIISERYNIVIISMPHTPVIAKKKELNALYAFIPDTTKPSEYDQQYIKNNYLGKYVERGNLVLEYLRKQTWVDASKIILLGHSQGAHIVAYLAEENTDIYAVGYFSGNPLGRYSQLINEQRNKSKLGQLTMQEAQRNIDSLYTKWKTICRGIKKNNQADSDQTWETFSNLYIDKLIALKMPLYIAYGTEDIGGQSCDILPIYFELGKKTNYVLRPFIGCGHNFEEIMPDGSHNYDKMYWNKAVKEFISWCDKL